MAIGPGVQELKIGDVRNVSLKKHLLCVNLIALCVAATMESILYGFHNWINTIFMFLIIAYGVRRCFRAY